MKINRKAIIITLILLVLTGSVFALRYENDNQEDDFQSNSQITDSNPQTEASSRNNTSEQKNNNNTEEKPDTEKEASSKKQVTPVITSTNGSTNPVIVRAIVDEVTSGSCTVIFSKQGYDDIKKSASVGLVATYYACKGFNVPRSQFPVKGEWQVRVEFNSETAEGTSETKAVVVE
jgi:flagellum-specific peptidoglycan hydrolase FlgJ